MFDALAQTLPAVLLGALPSFGNAFIASAVGYITQATGDPYIFHKVLLCLYIPSALVCWLAGRFDRGFDARYPAKHVHGFRVFVPACIMVVTFISIAVLIGSAEEFDSQAVIPILALACIIGVCSAALLGSGSLLMYGIGAREQVLIWIGISSAGLLCIATVYITGLRPEAPPSTARTFFFVGAGLLGACTIALGIMHSRGIFDAAYETASDPERASIVQLSDVSALFKIPLSSWILGANALMTVVCGPMLPFLCDTYLAQTLILWKLCMDFAGPTLLLALPNRCSRFALVSMITVRTLLLVLILLMLMNFFMFKACALSSIGAPWLILVWSVFMLNGALVTCFSDTYVGDEEPQDSPRSFRMRWNRLLYYTGTCIGLGISGLLIWLFFDKAPAGAKLAAVVAGGSFM